MRVRVMLLGRFAVRRGGTSVVLPPNVQRVVAFVALQDHPVPRSHVGAGLWPDSTEAQAGANLRSALWKLGRTATGIIEVAGGSLSLAREATVDLHDSRALARLAIASPSWWDPDELDVTLLSDDLLPGWYEEWVLGERDRYRQLRLHALESLCNRLTDLGRHGSAVQAGLAAVSDDPLRETARIALIRAFVAEGNLADARRHYQEFRSLLREELDVEPSEALKALVQPCAERR